MKTLGYISVGLQIYPYKRNDTCSFHISWSSCLSEEHGSIQMSVHNYDHRPQLMWKNHVHQTVY